MDEINKDELINLKKEMEGTPEIIEKEAKIIYDGRQYAIRIPAKIAKTMDIDPKVDTIKFKVTIPSKINANPELNIELIKREADKDTERDNQGDASN